MAGQDFFHARDTFDTGSGPAVIYRLSALEKQGVAEVSKLPFSIRVLLEAALRQAVARHRARTGDDRPIITNVTIVAWVTPLIKGYNHPYELLWKAFHLRPFAGVDVSAVYREPPAIGIAGIGTFAFASNEERDIIE